MPPASAPCENKLCGLLTQEENQLVMKLLGPRCQSLAMTVIQLYETQGPGHQQWSKRDIGVLSFVKDNQKKNYFFRLYCMKRNKMVWEQEMYNNLEYSSPLSYLHTFEGDDCMVCFNFANDDEAREMKSIVDAKIFAKRKREGRRAKNQTTNNEVQPRVQNNSNLVPKYTDPADKKAKRKRNITKADIGNPLEFRHISHVGWHPDKGFDVNSEDAALTDFFEKAGVSESQLKDQETRKFIYDFIAANGGRDAVLELESKTKKPPPPSIPTTAPSLGPPVPPRGAPRSAHNRAAPPPPSAQTPPPRPPPTTPRVIHNNAPVPPPPSGNAPPPPPPPLPPPMDIPTSPPMPATPVFSPVEATQTDSRSALMESIRGGATLKPVDIDKKVDDARGDLLSEIRKGFQLKPANEREVKPISPSESVNNPSDLAAALSRALAERNRFIHPDEDSDNSTDSNDDEWDA